MLKAFILGGVLALAAAAVLVVMAAAVFHADVRASLGGVGAVFAVGGVLGVVVRQRARRKASAKRASAGVKARDIRLPLFDPAMGGIAGLPPAQRVLAYLVRGDASAADVCTLFRSRDQARAMLLELMERGEIEAVHADGARMSREAAREMLGEGATGEKMARVLVQITDAGTERLGEVGGAGV